MPLSQIRRIVGAAAALTILCAAVPVSASDEGDEISNADCRSDEKGVADLPDWVAETNNCNDGRAGVESTDSETPQVCRRASRTSAAALRLCYKAAGVPASIVPALAAKVRALTISRRIAASAAGATGSDRALVVPERGPNSVPIAQVPKLPGHSTPDASCTVEQPENCRPLPPVPPQLNLEAPAIPPNLSSSEVDTPPRLERGDIAAVDQRDIHPSDGYDSPPDPPPRA